MLEFQISSSIMNITLLLLTVNEPSQQLKLYTLNKNNHYNRMDEIGKHNLVN